MGAKLVCANRSRPRAAAAGIKGYPTVRFFHKGRMTDYAGPRSAMAFVSFAQAQARVAALRSAAVGVLGGAKKAMSKVLGRQEQQAAAAAIAA